MAFMDTRRSRIIRIIFFVILFPIIWIEALPRYRLQEMILISSREKDNRTTDPALVSGISASNLVIYYQPINAPDSNAALKNIADPTTNNATPGIEPSWDINNGWIFVGASNTWLDTGRIVNQNHSYVVRFSNWSDQAGKIMIGNMGNISYGGFFMCPNRYSQIRWCNGFAGMPSTPGGFSSGTIAIAGDNGYKNGTRVQAGMSGGTLMTLPVFIGAGNNSGSPILHGSCYIQAIAIYDTVLTSNQIYALHNSFIGL